MNIDPSPLTAGVERRRGGEDVALPKRRGGAPGGAAPLRHWGARAVATARGGPRKPGPQGARRGARRLPALHVPRPRGRRKKGKRRRPAPENRSARAA